MRKTVLLLMTLLFVLGTSAVPSFAAKGAFGYDLEADINRKPDDKKSSSEDVETPKMYYGDDTEAEWEADNIVYYPNATLQSAVRKYQEGNYSGCLQEMITLTKIDEANPIVYYYMGMAYTQVGNKDQAVKAYEAVMKLNAERTLTEYALRGRDCLVGGPTCSPEGEEKPDEGLEKFVNSPYGNGFSDEINEENRQKELDDIQKTINENHRLDRQDLERIQEFDSKSSTPVEDKVAAVTNEEVLAAIETLKKAGVTVSVNPYQTMPMNDEYSQLSMLLGNNSSNNNSMMNMLPYFMGQNGNQKIDPQMLQSVMMNSMITDFTFTDKDKKY